MSKKLEPAGVDAIAATGTNVGQPAVTRRLLTDRQAAEYLGICSRSVYNLVARKQLPTLKVGRARRFDVEDLNAFIASRKILPSGWKERKPAAAR